EDKSLFANLPRGAKEVTFDFPFVDFGKKPELGLSKMVKVTLNVTVKSEIASEGNQVIKLEIPVKIDKLFTVGVERCGPGGGLGCPTFKRSRLPSGQKVDGV